MITVPACALLGAGLVELDRVPGPLAHVAGINLWRWPAEHRDATAALHAKLIVIDGRRAFVGSANLTARALHHNLEVGLLVQDERVATQLEDHVRELMACGVLLNGV